MELVFLGSGGGRFVLATQKRRTGGFVLRSQDFQIHVDPGPGALLNAWKAKVNPTKTEYLFVSHLHTDHYNDAPAMIEAMTGGTVRKKGVVIGSRMFIEGSDEEVPGITNFHKSLVSQVLVAEQGKSAEFQNFKVSFTPTVHGEPTGIGFVFHFPNLTLGYTADTSYYPGMEEHFQGSDVLIMNTIHPELNHVEGIMTLGDAIKLASLVKPKLAILTHFGIKSLRFGPERMASILADRAGVRCVAARDFLTLDLEKELSIPSLESWTQG